jgi:hypothetical protein
MLRNDNVFYAVLRIHFKNIKTKYNCSDFAPAPPARRRRRRELNDKLMSGRREKSPEYNGTNIVLV